MKRMRDERNAYSKILVGKHEGKTYGRPWRRGGNNVKMCVKEIGWKVVDWIQPVQDSEK